MAKPTDFIFPGLAGINPARDITERDETVLERLLEIGEEAIQKYQSGIKPKEYDAHHEIYNKLTSQVTPELPLYTGDDLQLLILAYTNKKEAEEPAIVRGLYTGMLASELTEKNQREGKKTTLHFNGGGNEFPFLLYFAHRLDEVVVEHFKGDNILSHAGSYGGSVNKVMLSDIKGNLAGAYIAAWNGRAETVTLVGIKGDRAGAYIAKNKGRVETVMLADIKGDRAGAYIAWNGGRAETVTLVHIEGDSAGVYIAWKGRVGTVTLADIKGDYAGAYIAKNKGRAGTVTLADIKGDYAGAFIAGDGGRAETVTLAGIKGGGAGEGIAALNGYANTITLAHIEGDWAGKYIASNGRAKTVTLAHIKGNRAGAFIAGNGGRVEQLFADDNEGKDHFEGYGRKIISLQKHKHAHRIEELLQQLEEQQEPKQLTVISRELADVMRAGQSFTLPP